MEQNFATGAIVFHFFEIQTGKALHMKLKSEDLPCVIFVKSFRG